MTGCALVPMGARGASSASSVTRGSLEFGASGGPSCWPETKWSGFPESVAAMWRPCRLVAREYFTCVNVTTADPRLMGRALKRVVYEKVRLAQEFRNFDFLSPWEGTDYVLPGDEKAK